MNNIPRIGDNIINNQIINQNVSNQSADSGEIVGSPSEKPSDTPQTEQKEYSLKQFRKDYLNILKTEVYPKLEPFEQKRIKYTSNLNLGLAGTIILIIVYIAIALLLGTEISIKFILGIFAAFLGIRHFFKKQLENEIKNQVMPILMEAVPGFKWTLNCIINESEVTEADLYPYSSDACYSTDDNFIGSYRGVNIAITEGDYCRGSGNDKTTLFHGAIIRLRMNKNFEGLTVIRPKSHTTLINKLENIELEDIDFIKKFKVFSTDQIEARYLLTTSFIERFKGIMKAFDTDRIYCSFYKNYVYIAPYTTKDLFSLANLSETLTETYQYDLLFEEFASILELVDHFKLDKKLGL